MALHWNVKNCDQSACWDKDENLTPTCESMIWATMILGIPEITEATIKEFMYRMEFDRRLMNTFPTSDDKPVSMELVRPFIGLKTNANKYTRAKWLKSLCLSFESRFTRENA